jgi:hypothetical protein
MLNCFGERYQSVIPERKAIFFMRVSVQIILKHKNDPFDKKNNGIVSTDRSRTIAHDR